MMRGSGKNQGGNKSSANAPKQSKRPRASSGDADEDPEVFIDSFLGALSDPSTMDRFLTSLLNIPELKVKLYEHLLPTLDQQVQLILEPLKNTVSELQDRLKNSDDLCTELAHKNDDLEQYTRRQNIRVSGISENDGEDTDGLIIDFAKNSLDIDLSRGEIDRSHRVGKKDPETKPVRDIIVRFVSYRSRQKVIKARRILKTYNSDHGTSHFISEDLTKKRSELAYKARQLKRSKVIKDTWTNDGKIFVKHKDDEVTICTTEVQLQACTAPSTEAKK